MTYQLIGAIIDEHQSISAEAGKVSHQVLKGQVKHINGSKGSISSDHSYFRYPTELPLTGDSVPLGIKVCSIGLSRLGVEKAESLIATLASGD
jgi:hypothetical protein